MLPRMIIIPQAKKDRFYIVIPLSHCFDPVYYLFATAQHDHIIKRLGARVDNHGINSNVIPRLGLEWHR